MSPYATLEPSCKCSCILLMLLLYYCVNLGPFRRGGGALEYKIDGYVPMTVF